MKHIYLLTVIFIGVMYCSLHCQGKSVFSGRLIPFCNAAGKWGYLDSQTKSIIIRPKFDDAQPFKNGYAVALTQGKYGIIDQQAKTVVPFKYPFVALYNRDGFTLVIIKKEYNAWWDIFKWKLMPDFNILSTSHDGPFLVTKVPRAIWEVQSLPGRKVLYRQKRTDTRNAWGSRYWAKDWAPSRTVPDDMGISSAGKVLLVKDHAYFLQADRRLKRVPGTIFAILNDSVLLAKDKGDYFTIGLSGKKIGNLVYREAQSIPFVTQGGEVIPVKKVNEAMPHYPVIGTAVFKDNLGAYYLFPDLNRSVPLKVHRYYNGGKIDKAAGLLRNAQIIATMDPLKSILIYTSVEEKPWRAQVIFLKPDGSWDTPRTTTDGLDKVLTDGRLIFSRSAHKGVLDAQGVFYKVPMEYIVPCQSNTNWYMGKDPQTGKYGVYDARRQGWQVRPVYSYLQNEIKPDIAIYSIVKTDSNNIQKEWYGLLNIKTGTRITPPEFDGIDENAQVIKTEKGKQVRFYINPWTGDAYRK